MRFVRTLLPVLVVLVGAMLAPLGVEAAELDTYSYQDNCGNLAFDIGVTNPNWDELSAWTGCDPTTDPESGYVALSCTNSNTADVFVNMSGSAEGAELSASLRCHRRYASEPTGSVRYKHLECRNRSGIVGATYDIGYYTSRGSSRVTVSCPSGFRLYHRSQ